MLTLIIQKLPKCNLWFTSNLSIQYLLLVSNKISPDVSKRANQAHSEIELNRKILIYYFFNGNQNHLLNRDGKRRFIWHIRGQNMHQVMRSDEDTSSQSYRSDLATFGNYLWPYPYRYLEIGANYICDIQVGFQNFTYIKYRSYICNRYFKILPKWGFIYVFFAHWKYIYVYIFQYIRYNCLYMNTYMKLQIIYL